MKLLKPIIILVIFSTILFSQSRPISTYSIVAYDENTKEFGVAVQSHWFSVGQLVPWAKAGVGAVATQSFVKVEYGPDGLKLMQAGVSAEQALKKLISEDPGESVRQVAMIDAKGSVAAHTGSNCIDMAGHYVGKNFSVQANMMENKTVWPAMAKAFENTKGDLAERMMAALEAAEKEGGDIRGRQSAAMIVVSGNPTGIEWKDRIIDIRVDDSPEPLKELKRLIRISKAYNHANKGDHYLEIDDIESALKEYDKATEYYPENVELPYWSAISLVNSGRVEEALLILKKVFASKPKFKKMTPRLIKSGLLKDDKELLKKIMEQ